MAITETVPFNFDELYSGLATQFEDAGYDTAEGSNTAQLITAMAYFTSMLNVNTAVNINELILPYATTRNNALADARALGYEIQHKQSYSYRLTLTLSGSGDQSYIIPKYSSFTDGNKTYYYMGAQIELANQVDGSVIEILVVEGTLYKYENYPETLSVTTVEVQNEAGQTVPQFYVDVPYVDIEENGIECYVTYYDDFGNLVTNEEWLKSEQFMLDKDLVVKNKFFRMDDIDYQTPRVYFELAGVGTGLRLGTTVNLNVLKTNGVDGALLDSTDTASITHALENITIADALLVTEGADEESIESIKENAPKFYNSANRAVTGSDYQAICNRQSSVDDSFIWGGEEELPKSPGHIWFSFLPSNNERVYTSDAFNQEYLLDNFTYIGWDYTFVEKVTPELPDGDFEFQIADANAYYSLRFIEDSEIKSVELNDSGQLIQPGVWDVLDNFKIPTLEFHNRHPIYLDFEYNIEILKYDVVTSKADINSTVFGLVDGFFSGLNDTFKAENFEIQYFHSSLEKRIDSFLTDDSGYNNSVGTKLLLTQKNVAKENLLWDYRDVFVPLDIPYETYFDDSGYLLYDVLPDIDTASFIDYRSLDDVGTGSNIPTTDMYTDWSAIQAEIDGFTPQMARPIIIAPIRISMSETRVALGAESTVTLTDFGIYPDDPAILDTDPGNETYLKTVVTHVAVGGAETVLTKDLVGTIGWSFDEGATKKLITLETDLAVDEELRVETEAMCGQYILFNSFKKYITVQLFVDALDYTQGSSEAIEYDTPKSYLTTLDELYDYTTDTFYLTTDGYSLVSQDEVDVLTGPVIKSISPNTYYGSPIKMDLFRRDRYLDLNYNSPNFAVNKNVIPRLKRVSFQ
jgi:hypothetical protein